LLSCHGRHQWTSIAPGPCAPAELDTTQPARKAALRTLCLAATMPTRLQRSPCQRRICATTCSIARPELSSWRASSAGLNGAAERRLSRSSRALRSCKRSVILLGKPFSLNCLCRRSARASTLAVRKTFSRASGNTTVPCRARRRPARVGGGRTSAGPSARRAPADARNPRGHHADVLPADVVADVAASKTDAATDELGLQPAGQFRQCRGAVAGGPGLHRAQRDQPVQGSAVEVVANRGPRPRAAPPCPCPRPSAHRS